MSHFVANSMHIPPDPAPMQLVAGDTVRVGDVDRVWPEFTFVLAHHGVGWVPLQHLSTSRPNATVLIPYDTRELAMYAGEAVELIHCEEGSAWGWCRASNGNEGWVPLASLDEREFAIERRYGPGTRG